MLSGVHKPLGLEAIALIDLMQLLADLGKCDPAATNTGLDGV
jgi:hypothetical protein